MFAILILDFDGKSMTPSVMLDHNARPFKTQADACQYLADIGYLFDDHASMIVPIGYGPVPTGHPLGRPYHPQVTDGKGEVVTVNGYGPSEEVKLREI